MITANFFHRGMEDGIELVVEGEDVLLNVVFKVTEAGDLERFSQTCFIRTQDFLCTLTLSNIAGHTDG